MNDTFILVNTMVADSLVTQVARASADMVLTILLKHSGFSAGRVNGALNSQGYKEKLY